MSPLAVTEDTLWGIPKLEGGSNYHEWSYDAEMVLRGKNLWTIVEGSESLSDTLSAADKRDFETRASLALSILTRTLHRGPKMLVYAERDPAKIWTKLAAKHQPKGRIYQVALRSQYIKLLASAGYADTMTTYLTELKVVVDKLAAVGVEMEEEVVTLDLLASLPTAFKTLVTAISAQQEVPALSFVEDKVLEAEERIKEHEDRAAPAGQAFAICNGFRNSNKGSNINSNNNNNNSNSNTSNTSTRKCDWCGINNHWSVDCRRRLQHQNLIEAYLQHNNLLPKDDRNAGRDVAAALFEPVTSDLTFDFVC